MKKEILMSFVAATMMASCSSDEELSNSGEKFNGNVTLTAEPYTFEDGCTRTTLTNTGSKIAFAWDDDEAIGIFPIAPTTNVQAKQVLKSGSGKKAFLDQQAALRRNIARTIISRLRYGTAVKNRSIRKAKEKSLMA